MLFLADDIIPGLNAVNAILEGPAKLDLIFERLSRSPEVQRPAAVMLVDKANLESRLKTGWEPSLDSVAPRVRAIFSGARQGGAWPIPLLLPGQWATFATAELRLINENLATMMAVTCRDLAALRELHLRIADAFVREGRVALAALGVPYPGTESGDAGLREMYERCWPSDSTLA